MDKNKTPEVPVKTEQKDPTVTVLFKNTYVGEHGIFYKKNTYVITEKLAKILKADIEVL